MVLNCSCGSVYGLCLNIRLCRTPLNRGRLTTGTTHYRKYSDYKESLQHKTNQNTRKFHHMDNNTTF